jgi:hypothetical protein
MSRSRQIRLAVIALILWEGFWLYTYLTAAIPDEAMAMPAAILFGAIVPSALAALIASAILLFSFLIKQRW